ncbi:MAG: DUF418 domain-containing protein [Acidobacteria bacterium]|nr:DUF418 domain-containing protein [Acidobacteriota bacterium]
MTSPTEDPQSGPVVQTERIDAIDVLRGFALLGILLMNVQSFAMPQAAYFNPTAYGDLEGANLNVWVAVRMLADQKFMTIFSMLFGAGIVLMAGRAEARGDGRRVHYRRMGWLLVIGLLHAHLLWSGDILFLYAVCGMLVYPLRRLPPGRLIAIGVGLLAVASAYSIGSGLTLPYWPEEAREGFATSAWRPSPEILEAELAAMRGGWLDQQPARSAGALAFETFFLITWGVWRAGGLMLIGMALFKREVFSARRSPRFYATLIAVAVAVGLPLQAYGIVLDFARGWSLWSFFLGLQFNYWPSIAVSLGYVGLVMLACRTEVLRGLTRPFAAVGQIALTNYLLQTVLCTTFFYGHGLGWFGSVDRVGQIGVVAAVWSVQLIASPLWLRRFRFGPVEWLWRSLTYGERPALRRAPASAPAR